jgi:hypothetical protein
VVAVGVKSMPGVCLPGENRILKLDGDVDGDELLGSVFRLWVPRVFGGDGGGGGGGGVFEAGQHQGWWSGETMAGGSGFLVW